MGNQTKLLSLLLLLGGCVATAQADTVVSGSGVSTIEGPTGALVGKSRLQFVGTGVTSVLQDTARSDRVVVTLSGGGGGGSPGAPLTSVQFNSGGTFAGSANLEWTGSALNLIGGLSANGYERLPAQISPAALAVDTDNYAPAGLATTFALRISASAAINLLGLTAQPNGTLMLLENVGTFTITIQPLSSGTAANSFTISTGVVPGLNPGEAVLIWYDAAAQVDVGAWQVVYFNTPASSYQIVRSGLTSSNLTARGRINCGNGLQCTDVANPSFWTNFVVRANDASIAVTSNGVSVGVLQSDAQHGNLGGGSDHALAVAAGAAGFLSGTDKTKIDSVTSGAAVAAVTGHTGVISSGGTSPDITPSYGFGANQIMQGNSTLDQVTAPAADVNLNSHKITSLATCTLSGDACPKSYVDSLVQGLQTKPPVRLATTAALAANTYVSAACVADTITITAFGTLTVDGVLTAANDRVLVKNEGTSSHDGIFVVTIEGTGASSTVLTRASDMNSSTEFPGAYAFALQGTTNSNTGWTLVADPDVAFTCGTTGQTWTQFTGAGDITFNLPLTKSGNTVSLNITAALNLNGSNLDVTAASPSVTVKSEATSASAGSANSFVRTDAQIQALTAAPSVTAKSEATAAGQGTSSSLMRADAQIQVATAASTTNVTSDANAATQGSSSSLLRADGRLVATTAAPTAASIHSDHDTATQGTSASLIRADAIYTALTAAPAALDGTGSNSQGTSNSLARADHIHAMPATISLATTFSAASTALSVTNTGSFGLVNLVSFSAGGTIPTAPAAGNLLVYSSKFAGRDALLAINSVDHHVIDWHSGGAFLWTFTPVAGNGTTTTGVVVGWLGNFTGTVAQPTPTNASIFASKSRMQLTGTAGANAIVQIADGGTGAAARGLWWRGNGQNQGGFFSTVTLTTETNTANTTAFVGYAAPVALATDPSTYTDSIGFGYTTAIGTGGNWQFFRHDSVTAATAVDLGSNCIRSTVNVLQFSIWCASNGTSCGYHAFNETTNALCAEAAITTNLPTNTVLMATYWYLDNNASGVAQVLDVMYGAGDLGIGAL